MSNKKQCSIQFLIDEMLRIEKQNHPRSVALKLFFESHGILISKAMKIHKEETIGAYNEGHDDGLKNYNNQAENYYNEKYGN